MERCTTHPLDSNQIQAMVSAQCKNIHSHHGYDGHDHDAGMHYSSPLSFCTGTIILSLQDCKEIYSGPLCPFTDHPSAALAAIGCRTWDGPLRYFTICVQFTSIRTAYALCSFWAGPSGRPKRKTTAAPPAGAGDPRPPPSVAAGVSTEIVLKV